MVSFPPSPSHLPFDFLRREEHQIPYSIKLHRHRHSHALIMTLCR